MNLRGKLLDPSSTDATAAALIGACGVGEPIAHYPVTALEGGADQVVEMHAARSKHEQRLRLSSHMLIPPIEHDLADPFRERRAAGLASHQDWQPAGAKAIAHETCHCGFACTFDPFKCNETPSCHEPPDGFG